MFLYAQEAVLFILLPLIYLAEYTLMIEMEMNLEFCTSQGKSHNYSIFSDIFSSLYFTVSL